MKTTTQELKQYITRLFQLSNNETWECEALEEAAENILPERFINNELIVRQNEWDSGISLLHQHLSRVFIWNFLLFPPGFVINNKSNIYYPNDVYQLHHYHTI